MRVLGNLHIDVAAATSLTPLGAGQAPCIRKRLFSRTTLRRKRTLGRDSLSGRGGRGPRLGSLVAGASFNVNRQKRETVIAYGHKSEIVNPKGLHRGGNDEFTNNPSPLKETRLPARQPNRRHEGKSPHQPNRPP